MTSDLFIQSRVADIARSNGVEVGVRSETNSIVGVGGPKEPIMVLVDLASPDYDAFEVARQLKKAPDPPLLFGFYPHVRAELKKRAEDVGFDYIVSNHDLVQRLASLLRDGSS